MARTFEADDWQRYRMSWHDPHLELEPLAREIRVIDEALSSLVQAGVLPHDNYDKAKMLAHRQAIRLAVENEQNLMDAAPESTTRALGRTFGRIRSRGEDPELQEQLAAQVESVLAQNLTGASDEV